MFKTKSPYIFAVAIAFILFQLFIVLNSFSSIYRMYTYIPSFIEVRGSFWTLFWFFSEFAGEIGLLIRFVGGCLFVAFAWILLKKNEFSLSVFRKAVLLEGVHYLFHIPFIIYRFTRPLDTAAALIRSNEVGLSYLIQTVLISSSFIMLYKKARHQNIESIQLFKWGAIAAVSFIFAIWAEHFLFNLYALPIDLFNPVLLVGLLNSTFTMLIAALLLLVTLMPVIKGKTTSYSSRTVGIVFILIGIYFIIYILVALVNSSYLAFLTLIELWAITFAVLGAGFLKKTSNGSY